MLYFTSDTHFGHSNIIGFCNRPFSSVEEMDYALVDRWNRVVQPDDTVWHVGDFAMLRNPERIDALLSRLHGHKHLVVGNHDTVQGVKEWESVHHELVILRETDSNGNKHSFVLFHYPLREWPGMWRGAFHLYGHVHGNMVPQPGSMELSADVWGGYPVSLDQILQSIKPFVAQDSKTRFQVQAW